MISNPVVSVAIVTYNQVAFIGKAIESVLSQKTDFEFEILIGDDFSNDGTREIIRQYADQYPDKIVPLLHPKNLGRNGMFNALETYAKARGKYLAAMDGDDYWTNDLKLQKQHDFLESHPDFVMCYHNALITFEDGSPSIILNPENQPEVSTLDDLIGDEEIWFMATSSVMFRTVLKDYPAWFSESVSGDIPRYVLLAKHGKIGYIREMMSVYRKNKNGTSFTDTYDDAGFLQNRIDMYSGINKELNFRYDTLLKQNMARYYYRMLESKQYQNKYWSRLPVAFRTISWMKPNPELRKEIIRDYIVPAPLMKLYSAIAIGSHKVKSKLS